MNKLNFGLGNAKLFNTIATFSLPAGHTCPFAKECFSKANKLTGRIVDGKHCLFRCYAASQESYFPLLRNKRWNNFEILRQNSSSIKKLTDLLIKNVPNYTNIIRLHIGGDFYSESYFLAWLNVSLNFPDKIIYGYTKALKYLIKYADHIPPNFRFTASKGGIDDHLIKEYSLKYAEVVFSVKEAEQKGLEIDHNDIHAIEFRSSFALLLHGIQPKGSNAAKAMSTLRKNGWSGYNRKSRKSRCYINLKIEDEFIPNYYFQ